MIRFLQAATLFASLSAALLIPPSARPRTTSEDITTVAGSSGPDYLSVSFRAPCNGCFVGTDEGLELELELDRADNECGNHFMRLNGLPLASSDETDVSQGSLLFTSKLASGLGERQVLASWESTCLSGQASLLSVRFRRIGEDDEVKEISGFSASFRQTETPVIMRLQGKPIDHLNDESIHEAWLHPEHHQRLIVMSSLSSNTAAMLRDEYQHLEALKFQIGELHREMRHIEGKILSVLKQEFKSCDGMKCLLQTAMRKAPDMAQLITTHFRHHPNLNVEEMKHSAHQNCSRAGVVDPVKPAQVHHDEFDHLHLDMEESDSHSPHPPPEHGNLRPPPPPPEQDQHGPPPPPEGEDDGQPPFAHIPPDDERHQHPPHPPFGHRPHPFPPSEHDAEHGRHRPPFPAGHHGRPGFDNFGPHHHHHRLRRHLMLAVGPVLSVVLLAALAFTCIRHRRAFLRDPRKRVDCAARREERRTRRAYRKAACRHKFSRWWSRYRNPSPAADYEEKREMILEQEGVLEDVMQKEINNLRTAHQLVGELVRAEEGRQRLYYEANLPPSHQSYEPAELDAGIGSSRRTTESLPTYCPPPPMYEEELAGDLTVVDGFTGYTPSSSGRTPESSVIDCSPRLSFETRRTTETLD